MIIDGHTVVTMVSVWGRPYIPTLLRPGGSETPDTVPVTVIAEQMHRFGLGVDVDIVSEGRRTATDHYAGLYATFLGDRPAAGRRTTTLVVRMDTRAADTTLGLLSRSDTAQAAVAATRRIVRVLKQRLPRTSIDRRTDARGVGGQCRWSRLRRHYLSGELDHLTHTGYVTSYFYSEPDVCAAQLADVWAVGSDHTTLVVHLRRHEGSVRVSATVRFTTTQQLVTASSVVPNRYTGRQWQAVAAILPGRKRITGLPSVPVTKDLDTAIPVGPSGVMIGKYGDTFLLMPLTDPAGRTRIAMDVDNDYAVRQLIRRAVAAGERVAVYNDSGRWAMASGSSRIWTSPDFTATPPRPPTLVVHNGGSNPYPGARASVAVGGSTMGTQTL